MRNIFDQYSQPENRVTHALMTAINEDRNLLGHFLRELGKAKPPADPRELSVLEQQYPGEEEPSEEELERRGIPDGWISDKEGWCVLILNLSGLACTDPTSRITDYLRRNGKQSWQSH